MTYADLHTSAGAALLNSSLPRAKVACTKCKGSGRYVPPGYPSLQQQDKEVAAGQRRCYVQRICTCIRS